MTKIRTCPACRRSMRCWALDWRRVTNPKTKAICLEMAISWRNGSFLDIEHYGICPHWDYPEERRMGHMRGQTLSAMGLHRRIPQFPKANI